MNVNNDFKRLQDKISESKLNALEPFTNQAKFVRIGQGKFLAPREELSKIARNYTAEKTFGDLIEIGKNNDLEKSLYTILYDQLIELKPWRKGPFSLFGIHIDSEWKCHMKWARLKNQIQPLTGKRVLDVGSGNGYFGFRMLEAGANLVIGLEPHMPYLSQFWAIKLFLPETDNYVLPYRLEDVTTRSYCFDTVFSMGVIYHRRSPIDHILQLKKCLAPTGQLVLETLSVEGPTGFCLTPRRNYARMNNVWFIPSRGTLEQWLTRCGFNNINVLDTSTTTTFEQRKTKWMPFDSLHEGLDRSNSALTIEGYPSPRRIIIAASLNG